jgi:hypothetical protein
MGEPLAVLQLLINAIVYSRGHKQLKRISETTGAGIEFKEFAYLTNCVKTIRDYEALIIDRSGNLSYHHIRNDSVCCVSFDLDSVTIATLFKLPNPSPASTLMAGSSACYVTEIKLKRIDDVGNRFLIIYVLQSGNEHTTSATFPS